MLEEYSLIIWDYNGTIIDDVGASLQIVNIMLGRRHIPPITLERYQSTIDIPISLQYTKLGFDLAHEHFDDIAKEYNQLYGELSLSCPLRKGVIKALDFFRAKNYVQAVLSSSKYEFVENGLVHLGVRNYFDIIAARKDILATGKSEIGIELLHNLNIPSEKTLMIGDMVHDFDVAQELSCDCILLENGHTSFELLHKTGAKVLQSVEQLLN